VGVLPSVVGSSAGASGASPGGMILDVRLRSGLWHLSLFLCDSSRSIIEYRFLKKIKNKLNVGCRGALDILIKIRGGSSKKGGAVFMCGFCGPMTFDPMRKYSLHLLSMPKRQGLIVAGHTKLLA
jgi:hypothetical protein